MMLSPNMPHAEDSLHLGKPRLDSGLALSKSTPDLNSFVATQAEIHAKQSKAEREAAREKAIVLRKKREDLKSKLMEKLLELRSICLQEAEITGKVPAEFPEIPGQLPPTISRRISTEFTLPSKFLEKGMITTSDAIEKLELEIEIQQQKANAARKLSEDKTLSKSARRSHHLDYLSQSEKLKQLKATLDIYVEERGRGKVSFSKTTDDVDYKPVSKGNSSDQAGYRTLPNRHKRHLLTPQQHRDSEDSAQLPYKIISDSTVDSISMSSNSSSVVSSGQDRQMAYHPESSSITSLDYAQPFDGCQRSVNHQFPGGSHLRRKDPSVSPSSVDSSDRASSGSGSISSLHLNPGVDRDSGTYNPYQDASLSARLDSEGDYSSYLRNTQKTYFRSGGGKYACGSLDRRKLVKKHGLDLASPNAALQVVELSPSKYGSKRDSAADSQDSPYSFQDADDSTDKPFDTRYDSQNCGKFGGPSHALSLGQLQASSSESGICLSAAEERRADARFKRDFVETCQPHYPSGNGSFRQDFGSLNPQDSRSRGVYSAATASDVPESLRGAQQERYELRGTRAAPWPSPSVWLGPAVQAKRAADHQTADADADSNAVDALFRHNSQVTQLKSVEYFRRNSSDVPINLQQQQSGLLSDYTRVNSSSSSSLSSHPPVPLPLRFVKVIPKSPMGPGGPGLPENESSPSYPHMSRPFKANGCSTLV